MPAPHSLHYENLFQHLVGTFQGEERLCPTGESTVHLVAAGRITNLLIRNGAAVLAEHERIVSGKAVFRGVGIFEWDPRSSEIVLRWWDSERPRDQLLRGRLSTSSLTLTTPGLPALRMKWTFDAPGRYGLLVETSRDRLSWARESVGTYRKCTPVPVVSPVVAYDRR